MVLVGESKAGKTRTAWEAIRALWPERRLLVSPRDDPDSFPALLELLPSLLGRRHPSVIWLDDLERYLGPKAITIRRLQEWTHRQPDLRVVATMTTRAWASIAEVDIALSDPRRETLARFTRVALSLLPDADERAEFTQRYPGQRLAGGFGEHFVAAQELRPRPWRPYAHRSGHPRHRTVRHHRRCVEDRPELARWRPKIGIAPKLTDAELLTLAVMQALLGDVSEARWLRFARTGLRHLFPYLPGQPGYNKRLRAATPQLK